MKFFRVCGLLAVLFFLSSCLNDANKYDYTNFQASKPRSILVLPPKNSTLEVKAFTSVFSHVSYPLAESGYYVFPVTVVDSIFKNYTSGSITDIYSVPLEKLHQVFGADAVLYLDILEHSNKYYFIYSYSVSKIDAKLVDAKTGDLLWSGVNEVRHENNASDIVGVLVSYIASEVFDDVDIAAKINVNTLLSADMHNGILHGPYSDNYNIATPTDM